MSRVKRPRLPDFVNDPLTARRVDGLSEEQLDTSASFEHKLSGVSRRDFMDIVKRWGATATYAAVAGMGGVFSAASLAQTVNTKYEKKFAKPAKHVLKLGTVFRWEHTKVQRAGVWEFAADLEERTDGEIRVEILPGNSICSEQVCIQKAIQGVLDIGTSSTQNASSVAPWLNAIDFPYMFQSSGQLYHFLMDPRSDRLFRKVYREKNRMEILWSLCEMRNLYMGLKWKDKEPITRIGQLAGTKNRVTNTQLGRIAMQLMELNPVPVAWVETLDAMKNGLIDGMETWTTATTAFNMAPVVAQYVGIKFIPGTGHVAINTRTMQKLGERLADEVMEAGHRAQVYTMYNNEMGLATISGEVPNPPPGSIFNQTGCQMNFFDDAALAECEEIASPTRPEYDRWHEKLNEMAGFNVYEELKPVARAYPKDARAIDVEPRRWWKSA
ncbi:MAG: TRAP transporter substrate-binding protein DctP [Gammaproteobacteria bacterium]|nr:TRAP transporter substrate-binding protein DctP [Gammaproteobacteria bacterium]